MGEGRELGGSAGLSRQRRLYVCVLWLTPIRRSLLFVFSSLSLSLWLDKRVRGLSLVIYISFEPLESTRFRAGSFPLRFH